MFIRHTPDLEILENFERSKVKEKTNIIAEGTMRICLVLILLHLYYCCIYRVLS